MTNKVNLKVIEGKRDDLENQISHALFTVFDQEILEKRVDDINQKLSPKGKLKAVSDTSQKLEDAQ